MAGRSNGLGAHGSDRVTDADKVLEFWESQAKVYGTSDEATAPDTAYRSLEIAKIKEHIRGPKVLDVGCGNGFSTLVFKDHYPDYDFIGVDYSGEMIKQAKQADTDNKIKFMVADVRELDTAVNERFDTIISERCLINLNSWEQQKDALLQMKRLLAPGGRIVLVENFVDGLRNLNDLRGAFDLPAIEVRWHNRYLDARDFSSFVHQNFKVTYAENIGNLYYIISRVVYAEIARMGGGEPQYDHPINYIAAGLPALGDYNFSPNMLHILEAA